MLKLSQLQKRFHWIYFLLSLVILTLSLWLAPAHAATAKASTAQAASQSSPVEDFIRARCDRDEASGCLDLGILREEQGKKLEAKLAYQKACRLGAKLACKQ